MSLNKYKCDFVNCECFTKSDVLTCKSICGQKFHSDCLNFKLPRNWQSHPLAEHFICSTCQDHQEGLNKLYSNLCNLFKDCINDKNSQIKAAFTRTSEYEKLMTELSSQLEDISSCSKSIEQNTRKLVPINRVQNDNCTVALTTMLDNISIQISEHKDRYDKDIKQLSQTVNVLLSSMSTDHYRPRTSASSPKKKSRQANQLTNIHDITDFDTPKQALATQAHSVINLHSSEGQWRVLGTKRIWKSNKLWQEYEDRQLIRQNQEREHRRKIGKEKKRNSVSSKLRKNDGSTKNFKNNDITNFNSVPNNEHSQHSDSNLLIKIDSLNKNNINSNNNTDTTIFNNESTKTIDASEHIDSTLPNSVSNNNRLYPNFIQGETLNPDLPAVANESTLTPVRIEPISPPRVQLTKRLIEQDGTDERYILSRIRSETKTREAIRDYLAYFKDQDYSVVVNGKTRANLKVQISSQGFPTEPDRLLSIYTRFHEAYELLTPEQIKVDLDAHKRYLGSERVKYLNNSDKNFKEFYLGAGRSTNKNKIFFLNNMTCAADTVSTSNIKLNIFYFNCSGMRTKIKKFFALTMTTNFNIIILTESWLNSNYNNEEILNKDWIIYRMDRDYAVTNTTKGGGVLIAISNNLATELIVADSIFSANLSDNLMEDESIYSAEYIFVKIKLKGKNIFLGTFYIPPYMNDTIYDAYLEIFTKFSSTLTEDDDCLIFGDFNRPVLNFFEDHDNHKHLLPTNLAYPIDIRLIDAFYSKNFYQVNNIKNDNGRTLDLCFINLEDDFIIREAYNSEHFFNNSLHHKALVFEYVCTGQQCSFLNNNLFYLNFKAADYDNINNFLTSIDWNRLLTDDDVNDITLKFNLIISEVISLFVPKKLNKFKKEPWISSQLKNLRNRRNRAYKCFRKYDDERSKLHYEALANCYNTEFFKAYQQYTKAIGEKIITDPKKFFEFVNIKRKCNGFPAVMRLNDSTADDTLNISNLFKQHFQNVYNSSNDSCDDSAFNYINCEQNLFNDLTISEEEILAGLLELDQNKGAGPDSITNYFLTHCAVTLSKPLHIIFNKSLNSATFPSVWKTSFLTPIFKSGNRNDVKNYRGIAILSAVPKFFEKIVCNKLTIEILPKLNNEQHGFVKNRSTITNLSIYTSEILNNLEIGHQIDAIYTDFSKAFDRVDHKILLLKLERIGIRGKILNWIKSYLTDRRQQVKVLGAISDDIKATSGVPQGSHLGPLLFNVFIADLSLTLLGVNHIFYADDLKIFHLIKNPSDSMFLQQKITALGDWCSLNKLELNIDKCIVISFSRKRTTEHFSYLLNNTVLTRKNTVRDLGILLDSQLNFNEHYISTIAKAKKILGFIKRRASEFNNLWVTTSLYFSLVRSTLEYGAVIWSPYSKVHSDAFESVQKQFLLFALRQMFDPSDYTNLPPYSDRLKILNISRLADRRIMLSACFTFDILNETINISQLNDKVVKNDDVRQTRHTKFLKEVYHRTDYGKFEPINHSIINFNNLTQFYDPDISKLTYKRRIIKFLNK